MKIRTEKFLAVLLSASVIIGSAAGCSSSAAQTSAVGNSGSIGSTSDTLKKKVINIGLVNDPPSFNPLLKNTEYLDLIFQPLVEMDDDLEYKPMLADKIETTDNQVFTVKLNEKATWTDGKPVTADDVIFTLELFTNPKTGCLFSSFFNVLEGTDSSGNSTAQDGSVSGAKKVDDHTVQLTTKFPVALSSLEGAIGIKLRTLPKHILKDVAPEKLSENNFFQEPGISNGAYKFVSHQKGQYVQFEANKDFYRGTPKVDQLNFKIMISTNLTSQLETGEIDMNDSESNIPIDDYSRLKSNPQLSTSSKNSVNVNQILFISTSAVPDARVRRAINAAINRQSIVDGLLNGEGEAAEGLYVKGSPYYNSALSASSYNPAEAAALIKEAGWDSSKVLNFVVPTGDKTREQVADIVVDNLKAIGIQTQVQKFDASTALSKARNHDFDLTIVGPSVNPNNPDFSNILNSSGSFNLSKYQNAKIDELLDTGIKEVDQSKRTEIYNEIQTIFAQDVPCCGLYQRKNLSVVNKKVTAGGSKSFGMYINTYEWDVQ